MGSTPSFLMLGSWIDKHKRMSKRRLQLYGAFSFAVYPGRQRNTSGIDTSATGEVDVRAQYRWRSLVPILRTTGECCGSER